MQLKASSTKMAQALESSVDSIKAGNPGDVTPWNSRQKCWRRFRRTGTFRERAKYEAPMPEGSCSG
ncbi:hypothetical protein DMH27_03385 [Raoultella planticola]|nr:hypothetical protein [Raoultella planticola]